MLHGIVLDDILNVLLLILNEVPTHPFPYVLTFFFFYFLKVHPIIHQRTNPPGGMPLSWQPTGNYSPTGFFFSFFLPQPLPAPPPSSFSISKRKKSSIGLLLSIPRLSLSLYFSPETNNTIGCVCV